MIPALCSLKILKKKQEGPSGFLHYAPLGVLSKSKGISVSSYIVL